jgi:hypothetical protein
MVTVGAVAELLEMRMPSPEVRVTVPPLLTVKVVALEPRTILPRSGAMVGECEIWIWAAALDGVMMAQAAAAATRRAAVFRIGDVSLRGLIRPPSHIVISKPFILGGKFQATSITRQVEVAVA